MINIKFQCTGKNESLNGEQKIVQVTFSPYGQGVSPTVATYAPGAAIGTPNAPQHSVQPENSIQYNASAFTATFIGDVKDAEQYTVGSLYEFTLNQATVEKSGK